MEEMNLFKKKVKIKFGIGLDYLCDIQVGRSGTIVIKLQVLSLVDKAKNGRDA